MTPIDPIIFKPQPVKPNAPIEIHSFQSGASAKLGATEPRASGKTAKKNAAPGKKAAKKKRCRWPFEF